MTPNLPVVVLCGGLGTRLRPALGDRPKALAPVAGAPFLALQLGLLRDHGARHFVLCVGHRGDEVEAALGDGASLGVRIDYSRDGERLLGTGGALKRAERYFAPFAFVVNGDTHIDVDLARLARVHSSARGRGAVATITLAEMLDTERYGTVELDENGGVRAFREKQSGAAGGWVNAGMYVIERELLDRIQPVEHVSLEREVFPAALRDGLALAAHAHDGRFTDIGTPGEFHAFARERESNHAA